MKPRVTTFFDEETFTATHVVAEPDGSHAAIVDSVLDFDAKSGRTSTDSADRLLAFVREQGLSVDIILETHVHADHLTAAPYLKEQLGAPVAIGARVTTVQETFKAVFNAGPGFATDGSQFDRLLEDGETFSTGSRTVTALFSIKAGGKIPLREVIVLELPRKIEARGTWPPRRRGRW